MVSFLRKPRQIQPQIRYECDLLDLDRLFAHPHRAYWESECRRLATGVPLGSNEVLCRTLGRYKMLVDSRDESLGLNLILDGFWELWITRFISRSIQPGTVCMDIGANVGYYTALMADRVGPNGSVIAVEPVPETFRLLKKNARLNDYFSNIKLLNAALSSRSGSSMFYVPDGDPKNGRIANDHCGADGEMISVELISVDELDLPSLGLVKVDVEGAEAKVWHGMKETVARSPEMQIVMEVNADRSDDTQTLIEDIASMFPLRSVNYDGVAKSITPETIFQTHGDVTLYLSRL